MAAKPIILIYEPEADMLASYASAFAAAGFDTVTAQNEPQFAELVTQKVHAVLFECDETFVRKPEFVQYLLDVQKKHGFKILMLASAPYNTVVSSLCKTQGVKILTKPLTMFEIVHASKLAITRSNPVVYDAGFQAAVIESCQEVFDMYFNQPLNYSRLETKGDPKVECTFYSYIQMTGDNVLGSTMLQFTRETVIDLVVAMLGADVEFDREILRDTAGEITNQVAGVLKEKLSHIGIRINIGLPYTFIGEEQQYVHPGSNEVGVIVFSNKMPKKSKGISKLLKRSKKESQPCIEFCFDRVA